MDCKGEESEPILNLEDDEPNIDDEDIPFNVKKRLCLDFVSVDKNIPAEADHMSVYLRIRPFSTEELQNEENQNCIEVENEHCLIATAPKDSNTYKNTQHHLLKSASQKFTFSKIFTEDVGQKQFFEEAVLGTVKKFINGQNCLMFTYGVTNSGKTYTIHGVQKDVGILPRALDVIFNSIKNRQWQGQMLKPHMFCDVVRLPPGQEEKERRLKNAILKQAELKDIDVTSSESMMSEDSLMNNSRPASLSTTSLGSTRDSAEIGEVLMCEDRIHDDTVIDVGPQGDIKFSVWVSFAEIYNENVYDLLEPVTGQQRGRVKRSVLSLREDKNGVPYVKGLNEVHVASADEAYKVLTVGRRNLQVACTKLNRNSSRSHSIFMIKMLRVVDKENPNVARTSMFSFCDLAGSERYLQTKSDGERIKEAGNINTSLLTLGRCIKVLRHNQINKDHPQVVPFRDSKLTRLFQSFFCGKGQASMIVNINQCASTFDETLHVLKYSAIAMQIVIVPENGKPKQKTKVDRQFSVLLHQTSRQTIGWATSEDQEEDMYDDEEYDSDSGTDTEREKMLLELVKKMHDQLMEEKCKQLELEARIREDVCQEMSKQIVDIETHYSERLKRERAHLEEKAEKRLAILTQSVQKSRKRQRRIDDSEFEDGDRSKIQKYEKEIEYLRDQVADLTRETEQLREAAKTATKQRDHLQQENTSIKFHMKDMEMKMEKSESSKLEQSLDQCRGSHKCECASKLEEAENDLERQRQMVTKLQQVIDMVQCNSVDVEDQLKKTKHELSQKTKQLEEELSARDLNIEDLRTQLREKVKELEEAKANSLQQDERLEELQNSLDKITSELESLQKENCEQEEMLKTIRQELASHDSKYNSQRDDRSNDTIDNLTCLVKDLQGKLEHNEMIIMDLEKEKGNLNEVLVALKDKVNQFEEESRSAQRQLDQAQSLVLQRESEIEKLSSKLLSVSNAEELLRKELISLRDDNRQLTTELQAALDLQKEYEAIDTAREKELESAFAMQDKLKEDLKKSEEALAALRHSSQPQLDELYQQLDTMKRLRKESQDHLEDYILKVNEQVETIGQLKEQLNAEKQEKANLENELATLRQEKVLRDAELDTLQREMKNVHSRCAEADMERKQLQEKIRQLTLQLSEKEGLLAEMEEKCSTQQACPKVTDGEVQTENEGLKSETCVEIQDKNRIADLEAEIRHLKLMASHQDKNLTEVELEVRQKVSDMIAKLDDAEYSHQISCRQLHQEKQNIMETLEAEKEDKEELANKVNELCLELDELQERYQMREKELREQVEKYKSKALKLEAVIEDLEMCLKSSKEHEAKALCELDNLRQKYKYLENDCNNKEDTICSLNDELERIREESVMVTNSSNAEAMAQIEFLKKELSDKERIIDELESELQKSKDENINHKKVKHELEDKLNDHLAKVDKLMATIEDLRKETLCKRNLLEELESELENVKEMKTKCESDAQSREKAARNEIKELKQEIDHLKVRLNDETTTENLKQHLENVRKEVIREREDVQRQTEKLEQQKAELEEKLKTSKSIDCLEQELQCVKEERDTLKREIEAKIQSAQRQINELEKVKCELEEKLKVSIRKEDQSVAELQCLRQQLSDKEKIIDEMKSKIQKLKEEKIAFEKEAEASLQSVRSQNDELQKVRCELEDKLKGHVAEVDKLMATIEDLRKETLCKRNLLEELESELENVKEMKTKCESDAQSRDKAARNEIKELKQEIDHLRVRLNDSSKEIKTAKTENKMKLESLKQNLSEREDELDKTREKVENLKSELETYKSELESKEEKLQKQNTALNVVKKEKEECEKIIRAKEVVIEQLKKALREQEAVMQDQDLYLHSKEESLKQTAEELKQQRDTIQLLQKKEKSYEKEISILQEETNRLRNKLKEAEDNEEKSRPLRGRSGARKSTRSSKHLKRSSKLDENEDPSLSVYTPQKEACMMEPPAKKSSACVLSNSINTPGNTPRALEAPKSGCHKRRLKSTMDEPLTESPPLVEQPSAEISAHNIVKRKLRPRKK